MKSCMTSKRANAKWRRPTSERRFLRKLREIDEVAYLRYASVHRRFEDVSRFVDEIHALSRRVKADELQKELFSLEIISGWFESPMIKTSGRV